ncbi:coiled-coil domain-containing protein 157-like, partial [Antrostomus carolinensis]|uniref:coiled-coil domain-containing protein 157-like n=1 Tax=Antrostomus carolinensis TaxID=279965 RepID=UPI0010A9835B
KKTCRKEIPRLRSVPQAAKPDKKPLKPGSPGNFQSRTPTPGAQRFSPHPPASPRAPDSKAWRSSLPRAACSAAKSGRSVPTQTPGSPLGPCDTCASAQASLHEVSKAISSICQSQNIPSALGRFQETLESAGRTTLSAMDMSHCASEQSKDLSRISKHLQLLLQQVQPLKAELEELKREKEKLQKQVKDLSRLLRAEKETRARQRMEAEQRLEVKNKEHLEAVARLERD